MWDVVACCCVPSSRYLEFFLLPIVVVLYFFNGNYPVMPTPSLSSQDCHDAAHRWGWKWVDQDNQEMRAKAIMRWACAACGGKKDVPFDNMKKFGPGKHSCSPFPQPQSLRCEAKAKDTPRAKNGRPTIKILECNQLAEKHGCHWMGVVVDNTVHTNESFVTAVSVMRWQCSGCATNFDRSDSMLKSRGFVCRVCQASKCNENKQRAGQAGSKENKERAGQAGSKGEQARGGGGASRL